MELISYTNSDEQTVTDQLTHGSESVNYDSHSRDNSSSVYWMADTGPQAFFEEIVEDFDSEDYGMAVLTDAYGKTLEEEHQGPLETTVGELTEIEDFYDRVGFFVVGDGDYEATWERTSDHSGVEDNEICFLLKSDESVDNSLLEEIMDETLEESDRFYQEVRELHRTDFEDLKTRV